MSIISTEKVVILDIEFDQEAETKGGKSYKYAAVLVKGKKDKGEKRILNSVLTKAPEMKKVLESLSSGDIATIVVEKEDESQMFGRVVGVHAGDVPDGVSQVTTTNYSSESKTPFTPFKPKSTYDNKGQQIGNALNNASVLLANGVKRGSLREIAEEILFLSEELRANLEAGKYNKKPAKSSSVDLPFVPDTKEPSVVVDDDTVEF